MNQYPPHRAILPTAAIVCAALSLGACADMNGPAPASRADETAAEPAPAPVDTRVYVYRPDGSGSAGQLDRDRYECHVWAVEQSGFDPSLPGPVPKPRVEVVMSPPPGADIMAGAVTGAIIGAAVSHPRDSGKGAAVGAAAGAAIGAASESARRQETQRIQQRYDQERAATRARLDQQANAYRRAISACFEGRGYTVR